MSKERKDNFNQWSQLSESELLPDYYPCVECGEARDVKHIFIDTDRKIRCPTHMLAHINTILFTG